MAELGFQPMRSLTSQTTCLSFRLLWLGPAQRLTHNKCKIDMNFISSFLFKERSGIDLRMNVSSFDKVHTEDTKKPHTQTYTALLLFTFSYLAWCVPVRSKLEFTYVHCIHRSSQLRMLVFCAHSPTAACMIKRSSKNTEEMNPKWLMHFKVACETFMLSTCWMEIDIKLSSEWT